MTKKQLRNRYEQWLNNDVQNLYDVYKNPSSNKWYVWEILCDIVKEQNGFGLSILGHNCSAFTCGHCYRLGEKLYFEFNTKDNCYTLEVE